MSQHAVNNLSPSPAKLWRFPGGIHPAENKAQSLQSPIKKAPLSKELIFPLSQHIGAPASPCVAVGDNVLKGQIIAKAEEFVSAPVHASSSGKVVAIEERPIAHPSGLTASCIVIHTDGLEQSVDYTPCPNYQQLDKTILLEKIRNAGIAGMGGAGFPSAVKLATDRPIDTLIINATECEPYITADDALIQERAASIVTGIKIIQQIIQPTKDTLIGIEDNKPQAIEQLTQACQGTDIQVRVFPTKYPSGGEKQLIYILTGKEVPSGKLPASIGIVCQNIGTTAAIKEAIVDGKPLMSRITTLTGNALQAQNYEVLLGTPVIDLLTISQFMPESSQRLIMGGPMMGFALSDSRVPVVKTTNCILAPSVQELPLPPIAQACIRCGLCSQACPAQLLPQQLYWYARSQNHTQLEAHHLFDCIECGACSYSCPSNIPLVQYYRSAKADIRQEQADKIKSDKAKQRFELRQRRLEQEEQEKEAKKAARKAAAMQAKQGDKQDIVAAAIARSKNKQQDSAKSDAQDNTLDPAQAAIEKAKLQRANPQATLSPKAALEKDITMLTKRIDNAERKMAALEDSGSDKIDILKQSLHVQREKLSSLREKLSSLEDATSTTNNDPAQAAIERAKQAREQHNSLSMEEKRAQELNTLEKRITKQQSKYDALINEDAEKAQLIKASLDTLKEKRSALIKQQP